MIENLMKNLSSIVKPMVELVSTTKDSIHISWSIGDSNELDVRGYEVKYQAIGSQIIQIERLHKDYNEFNIVQLHERTNYEVCVNIISSISKAEQCIEASTASDYLAVPLGSTFGAFIALGIIVMFVMIARCQNRKKQNHHSIAQQKDSYNTVTDANPPSNGEIEMSDVSYVYQANDDTTNLAPNKHPSQTSTEDLSLPKPPTGPDLSLPKPQQDPRDYIVEIYPNFKQYTNNNTYPLKTPDQHTDAHSSEEGAVGGVLFEAGAVGGAVGGFEPPLADTALPVHNQYSSYVQNPPQPANSIRHNFTW